jgi:hypothetical protein
VTRGGAVQENQYVYDAIGNIRKIKQRQGASGVPDRIFAYDNRGKSHQTACQQHSFKDTRGWYFDEHGNRLSGRVGS